MLLDHVDPKYRQGLAVAVLMLLSLGVVFGLIMPLVDQYYENQSAIIKLESRLRIYEAKIGSRDLLLQQASAMKNAISNLAIFSGQRSIPLATADMQQQIKNAVALAGGELTSTENLANKQFEGLLKISINVRFSGRVETLKNVLYELENAKPFLLIDKIKILGVVGQRNIETGKMVPVDKVYVSADIASFLPNIR